MRLRMITASGRSTLNRLRQRQKKIEKDLLLAIERQPHLTDEHIEVCKRVLEQSFESIISHSVAITN